MDVLDHTATVRRHSFRRELLFFSFPSVLLRCIAHFFPYEFRHLQVFLDCVSPVCSWSVLSTWSSFIPRNFPVCCGMCWWSIPVIRNYTCPSQRSLLSLSTVCSPRSVVQLWPLHLLPCLSKRHLVCFFASLFISVTVTVTVMKNWRCSSWIIVITKTYLIVCAVW